MRRITWLLVLVCTSTTLAGQAPDARAVMASIDAKAKTYGDVALRIWSFAEVGYQETRSSALLQEQLKGAGFGHAECFGNHLLWLANVVQDAIANDGGKRGRFE